MDRDLQLLISQALKEDGYDKDVTSLATLSNKQECTGNFIAKAQGVISGMYIVVEVFRQINPKIIVDVLKEDGEFVNKGDCIACIKGKMIDILRGERVALNFLQRMSGIATMTDKYVQEVAGTQCQIEDTRKTTPLLRKFERLAVMHGGAKNHRFNLSDQVLIKDNHIAAVGSITNAVEAARAKWGPEMIVEVEVETKEEYLEALETSADIIMLDNMSNELMGELCEIPHEGKKLEASGNMTINRLRSVAMLGVDYISVGGLTHSAKALDISLKFLKKSFK